MLVESEKIQEDWTLWLKVGERGMERVVNICMYINAVTNSFMLLLYLWHDFCNIIFKIKHKLYIASGSAHSSQVISVCI